LEKDNSKLNNSKNKIPESNKKNRNPNFFNAIKENNKSLVVKFVEPKKTINEFNNKKEERFIYARPSRFEMMNRNKSES